MNTRDKINKMLGKKENCPLCGKQTTKEVLGYSGLCNDCYEKVGDNEF